MGIGDKIVWGILIVIMVLGVIGWSWMMAQWDIKSSECVEEYGGKVTKGYCVYVEDGNSKSFDIWRNEDGT